MASTTKTIILETDEQIEADAAGIYVLLNEADLTPALEDCLELIRLGVADNFQRQADGEGNAWPERKVLGDGHPILAETGRLWGAATGRSEGAVGRIEPRTLEAGVDPQVKSGGIPGAAAHQFGFPPRNLPARPWLVPPEETLDACQEVLADFVDDQI